MFRTIGFAGYDGRATEIEPTVLGRLRARHILNVTILYPAIQDAEASRVA